MFLAIRYVYVCTVELQKMMVFFIAFIGGGLVISYKKRKDSLQIRAAHIEICMLC